MTQFDIEHVLIIHPFGIGDALFLTPIIRSLHEHGAKKIDLVLGSRTKELFEKHPYVNQIFVADQDKLKTQSRLKNIRDFISFFWILRQNCYRTLFDFSFSMQYALFAFLFLGIPNRVGFSYKSRGFFLSRKIKLEKSFNKKHVVEYYLDLLKLLFLPSLSNQLELFLAASDEQEAKEVLKSFRIDLSQPFIVVAPGGGESWGKDAWLKRWPVRHFFDLVEKIKNEHAISFDHVLILGGKKEWELGEFLRELGDDRFYNLCGKTSLRGSAVILKHARLLIANDGGLVHMASAVGTPTIAIFGPVDPHIYGPYPPSPIRVAVTNDGPECRPCYRNMRYKGDCQHVDCLRTLEPEKVFQKVCESGLFELSKVTPHP